MGVGINERPLVSSCTSCGLSVYLLKLCMLKLGFVKFFGLTLKNDLVSFASLLVVLMLCFFSFWFLLRVLL